MRTQPACARLWEAVLPRALPARCSLLLALNVPGSLAAPPPAPQLLVSGDHSVAISVDEPVMAALNIYVDLSE